MSAQPEPSENERVVPAPSDRRSRYGRRVLLAFGAACVTIQIGFGEMHGRLPVVLGVAGAVAVVFWVTRLLV